MAATTIRATEDSPEAGRLADVLDLSGLPKIFILDAHLSEEDVCVASDRLRTAGATLTRQLFEAQLILGAIKGERRAVFELRARRLSLVPLEKSEEELGPSASTHTTSQSLHKKRKHSLTPASSAVLPPSGPPSEIAETINTPTDTGSDGPDGPLSQLSLSHNVDRPLSPPLEIFESQSPDLNTWFRTEDHVKVVRLDWLNYCVETGRVNAMDDYVLFEGKRIALSSNNSATQTGVQSRLIQPSNGQVSGHAIDRAKGILSDSQDRQPVGTGNNARHALHVRTPAFRSSHQNHQHKSKKALILRETTSEHDEGGRSMQEMPAWVKEKKIYACERPTPLQSPNDDFIDQLDKIKLARILKSDEIGVRAYSTSIASIAAYPYPLTSVQEILSLPGCDQKIALLFRDYQENGYLQAAQEVDNDPELKVLRSFYGIWGVGPKTARDFYHLRGWRSIDNIVESGWSALNPEQQIGLKYQEEFESKISRSEVEYIASIVTYHAKQLVDDGIECIIVGGYRRGKPESGDVDLILTHRREDATAYLLTPLVNELEQAGWISHTLTLSEAQSHRDQQPLPTRSSKRGGFDALDKALVVWQDPIWRSSNVREDHTDELEKANKNPNIHRRVDIIVSPWRTIGCAVTGWTSGTTFQRDLRRYAQKVKGWKFDSSGVRDRATGKWVDLEGYDAGDEKRAKTWQEAERRVFVGLGLEWLEPEERCTR